MGACKLCGAELDNRAVDGMCLMCYQLYYNELKRQEVEEGDGVDSESIRELTKDINFSDEDYKNWVTFGQGHFTPQFRAECRAKWLVKNLVGKRGWTRNKLASNLGSLYDIMNENFDYLFDTSKYLVKIKGSDDKNIVYTAGNVVVLAK